jgi:CBS domain-containing protein
MRVGDVMNVRLVSVRPEDSVLVAIIRMKEENVGSVAVCDGPRLVGIFTERDVLRLASEGRSFRDVTVGVVMTPRPVTVDPDVSIVDAAHLMGKLGVRHLPVVEGENLHGMVGIRDVMRTLVERAFREHDAGARDTAQELLRRR